MAYDENLHSQDVEDRFAAMEDRIPDIYDKLLADGQLQGNDHVAFCRFMPRRAAPLH